MNTSFGLTAKENGNSNSSSKKHMRSTLKSKTKQKLAIITKKKITTTKITTRSLNEANLSHEVFLLVVFVKKIVTCSIFVSK